MGRHARTALLTVALLFAALRVSAQYYTWGADAPMKWSEIRTPEVRVIYPDTARRIAEQTFFYLRHLHRQIGYGFSYGPMQVPVVLHPQNFQSNGLTMYLPKRIELLTTPDAESYALPWIKQLAVHEYRHAVQFNNLNRGLFRILRYAVGQQSPTVGLLCMPAWAMEGDAVMAETQAAPFGRALQPSFTMGYRAMEGVGRGRNGRWRRNPDKWFCGSYRDYIPDHYRLGYQINTYAERRYGEPIWNKVVHYAVRNPYLIATTHVGLKRYYGTTVNRLFRETFDALQTHWDSIPTPPQSARPLVTLPEGNYTTYQWPIALGDTAIIAVKSDFDRPTRLVRYDRRTGREELVARTGVLSSRPTRCGSRIWWSEYRASLLFDERVNSKLCYLDLPEGRPRTVDRIRNALYPAGVDDTRIAWAEYDCSGRYSIAIGDGRRAEQRFALPADKEIHGLCWENRTAALYALITDDSGMWIARLTDEGVLQPVTAGSPTTLSDLSAADGKLYFGSIASGRDEVHALDLATGREYRLTRSTYGAFDGAPLPAGDSVAVTLYGRRGYALALQSLAEAEETAPAALPVNLFNPPLQPWPLPKLDTLRFTAEEAAEQQARHPKRRYHKALHAFNIHSWAPVAFDPFEAVDEHCVDLNFGATLLSQNLLSNTEAFASYGWNRDEGSMVRAGLFCSGWGVRLGFRFDYGGDRLVYRLSSPDPEGRETLYQPLPAFAHHRAIEVSASLPLLFQRGYHTRQLTLSAAWNYSNGRVADLGAIRWNEQGGIDNLDQIGYRSGLHKLTAGIAFSDQVRLAHRDFAPRFGYRLQLLGSMDPTNDDFSKLLAVHGSLYLPGVAPHHSLQLTAAWQNLYGGARFAPGYRPLSYRSSALIPTGFASSAITADRYRAVGADYQLPIAYPDGGICSVLYLKRIRLNIGGQWAAFRVPHGKRMIDRELWSVGGDLIVDFNLFRMPVKGTSTLKISCYRPSSGRWWFGSSLGLPF